MIILNARVDDATAQLRLRSMGIRVRERVRVELERQAIRLVRIVKEEKLSGQVLKNRTGRLRRSINYRMSIGPGDAIVATVGTNVPYAHIHEYGFEGMETVRAHVRRIRSRDVQERGKQLAQGVGFVREHERHMHMPVRSFLRSTLREQFPTIRAALREAVAGAVT